MVKKEKKITHLFNNSLLLPRYRWLTVDNGLAVERFPNYPGNGNLEENKC